MYETFNSKEDILNQYLWYNEKLKITNKTIYLKSFDDCGIRKIADITNEDGSLKSYNDVCSTFNTATTNAAFYAKVVKAIPTDWKELIKKYRNIRCLLYESTQRTDHSHQRYSNTVSLYSTSIFTHSHICTINDP